MMQPTQSSKSYKPSARQNWKRLAKLSAMLLPATLILSACNQTLSGNGCQVFGPIRASDADTRSTKNQVATHNAKGISLCQWRP